MTEDNKNLIPLGNGRLPAIIERRTQIANRVLGQLSADQTEAFFRKYPEFLLWKIPCAGGKQQPDPKQAIKNLLGA